MPVIDETKDDVKSIDLEARQYLRRFANCGFVA
jgi:hypothetical protein